VSKAKRKLNDRECAIGFIVLGVFLFGFAKMWFLPTHDAILETSRRIDGLQKEIALNKASIEALQLRSVASVPSTASPMKEYVTSSRHLAQVVQHLIADDSHLVTRFIGLDHSDEAKDSKDVSFNIEIVGSFPAIGGFIERLESSHLLAQVISVNVSRTGIDLDKCVAKIGVSAHLFPESEND
jgi:hypothetical protein